MACSTSGAAALAGTTFPIDRLRVAKTLGFEDVCHNSLDAVSDRDFAIEFTAAASILMMHISRMSEELVMWISPRIGFIDIADRSDFAALGRIFNEVSDRLIHDKPKGADIR